VKVVNADTGEVLDTIPGFQRDHGIALVKDLNKGFKVANGSLRCFMNRSSRLRTRPEARNSPQSLQRIPRTAETYSAGPGCCRETGINATFTVDFCFAATFTSVS
jgi:hypothetical protein